MKPGGTARILLDWIDPEERSVAIACESGTPLRLLASPSALCVPCSGTSGLVCGSCDRDGTVMCHSGRDGANVGRLPETAVDRAPRRLVGSIADPGGGGERLRLARSLGAGRLATDPHRHSLLGAIA